MQPKRDPFMIQLDNGVELYFDANDVDGKYPLAVFTRQGARITGWFPLSELGRLADAINAEIFRVEMAGKVPEEDAWVPGPDACKAGNVVFQCLHGNPQGGCKCMGRHEVVVMPCPEGCPGGQPV